MPQLSSAMRTELAKPAPMVFWVLELGLPGGTKYYAEQTVSSAVKGTYHGRILSWGGHGISIPDRECRIEGSGMEVEIEDVDFTLGKIIEGTAGNEVGGSTALWRLASPNVPEADWYTRFTGVVATYNFPAPLICRMSLRPNDLQLRRQFPKLSISMADWPNSHPSARGQGVPLLYGNISSGGAGGAVPTLLVDIPGSRYMASAGRIKGVDPVYADGAAVSSGYSITYPVVNGRTYTLIDFTTDQGDAVITCDAQGFCTTWDGSTLIENPVDQVVHMLSNWGLGDYMTGSWLGTSALIDTTYATAAALFFTNKGHKGSRLINGPPQTGKERLDEWLTSNQVRAWWSSEGKIRIKVEDPHITTIYLDDPWWRYDRHNVEDSFSLMYDDQKLLDRITVSYLFDYVAENYTQTLEVRDPTVTQPAPEAMDLPWSYGAV